MLLSLESSPALLVTISGKSVSICTRFHARLVDSSTNRECERAATSEISVQRAVITRFEKGYPYFTPPYGGLLKLTGSKLKTVKSAFYAEKFKCMLSCSICSDVGAIHS